MRRREFMAVLAGATTVATRRDAGAQQTPRVWRIGMLDTAPRQLNGPNLEPSTSDCRSSVMSKERT